MSFQLDSGATSGDLTWDSGDLAFIAITKAAGAGKVALGDADDKEIPQVGIFQIPVPTAGGTGKLAVKDQAMSGYLVIGPPGRIS